ncbi:MAG: FAD-linked oxidase C-terminal domain-containing protein, partial [Chlamydiota bacterium]
LNLVKLIVGSEGTLGIITQVKVRIAKRPKFTGLCLLFYHDVILGMGCINEILDYSPLSVEMIDHHIIEMGVKAPALKGKTHWLNGSPDAIFIVEFQGETLKEVQNQVEEFRNNISKEALGYHQDVLYEPKEMNHIWAMRKAGLGLLLSKRTYSRAIAFIEDITVAPEHLASFMKAFKSLLVKYKKDAGVYGHVGSGCMHIRPYVDLRDHEELKLMKKIMLNVTDILMEHGGALSGEHGDGYIRSWLNEKLFGKDLYEAFKKVKLAFDPQNLMNPNKIVDGKELVHDLRMSPTVQQKRVKTFLSFEEEGGFELSVDMCNGNATCRKPEKLMCPPFQVTRDETHTTRARAQMLRSIVNGKQPFDNFTSDQLYEVMDLCIECKGCKKECPSQVDMAKMKSEFLYHYYKKHSTPFRNYLFAYFGEANKLLQKIAKLFNRLTETSLNKKILSLLGISPKRPLPELAQNTFSSWTKKKYIPRKSELQVLLFTDTYTEFNSPEIGIAAVKILDALGYHVQFNEWTCCGRPMISKGMLPHAKVRANLLLENIKSVLTRKVPFIILEPSCHSAVVDDYKGLISDEKERLCNLSDLCYSFEGFLVKHITPEQLNNIIDHTLCAPVHFHGHCHQKSLFGTEVIKKCLGMINGQKAEEIDSGCCGMAGSFGYESEHYDMSMEVGNLHLFPYINKIGHEDLIVANGTSCRSQIHHGTERKPLHIAEYIASLMKDQ